MKKLWIPISKLGNEDKYQTDLLLCAPELVDLDCNKPGIGMGYWQDGIGWLAAKWNMTSDGWAEVKCNPTHYIIMAGPA